MREVRAMYQVRPSHTNRRDKDAEGWVGVVLKGWGLGELGSWLPRASNYGSHGPPGLDIHFAGWRRFTQSFEDEPEGEGDVGGGEWHGETRFR